MFTINSHILNIKGRVYYTQPLTVHCFNANYFVESTTAIEDAPTTDESHAAWQESATAVESVITGVVSGAFVLQLAKANTIATRMIVFNCYCLYINKYSLLFLK